MHVIIVVPARKVVPFGMGHETTIALVASSGSETVGENVTFALNVCAPKPAVAGTVMFGCAMSGGVRSASRCADATIGHANATAQSPVTAKTVRARHPIDRCES